MSDPTISAPAPSAPEAPVAPSAPVEKTLAQFRAEKAAPVVEEPEPVAAPAAPAPQALSAEPPEPPDDGDEPPVVADPAAATQELKHKWKSETGVTLDLRRRDHRKIKRDYEEMAALRAQLARMSQPQPVAQPAPAAPPTQPKQAYQPDPSDPEPTLEQFAEEADPYAAHTRALARWEARQEFKQQQAASSRVERGRQVQAAIAKAQEAYDAGLSTAQATYPDFDDAHTEVLETLARVPLQARAPLVQRLLTSPVKHDLTHYLGTHPEDLAAVVGARSAYEQALALGAIETRVRALVNQRSRTPAPPNPPAAPMAPVNGGGTPTTYNPATANLQQFRRKHGVIGGRAVSA